MPLTQYFMGLFYLTKVAWDVFKSTQLESSLATEAKASLQMSSYVQARLSARWPTCLTFSSDLDRKVAHHGHRPGKSEKVLTHDLKRRKPLVISLYHKLTNSNMEQVGSKKKQQEMII